ncbi:hypothetical protein [Mucilaginibacter sp. HD30]
MQYLLNSYVAIKQRLKDFVEGFKEGYNEDICQLTSLKGEKSAYAQIGDRTYLYDSQKDIWKRSFVDTEDARRNKNKCYSAVK